MCVRGVPHPILAQVEKIPPIPTWPPSLPKLYRYFINHLGRDMGNPLGVGKIGIPIKHIQWAREEYASFRWVSWHNSPIFFSFFLKNNTKIKSLQLDMNFLPHPPWQNLSKTQFHFSKTTKTS